MLRDIHRILRSRLKLIQEDDFVMRTSQKGQVELVGHEAIVTSSYLDSVKVWTWGVGHTAAAGSPKPGPGLLQDSSIPEIMHVFGNDLSQYERRVEKAFTVQLTQEQFDAAVSFDFNTGGILRASWVRLFNSGDVKGARSAFMQWNKPSSIIGRRKKECKLFFDGIYSNGGKASVYPADASGNVLWKKGKVVNVDALLNGGDDDIKPVTSKTTTTTAGTAIVAVAGASAYYSWSTVSHWIAEHIGTFGGLFH